MKNIIKKIAFVAAAFIAVVAANPNDVFAAASFNNDPQDLRTVRVSNYSAQPGSMSWSSSVNSSSNQIVSVGIYYHNTGDTTASNTRIRLSPQNSGSDDSHTFTATIYADNASSVTGSATVNIVGGDESLTYIPTAVYWYPNQACKNNPNCQPTNLLNGQNGSELFSSNGLRIGNIAPGWASQGGITVQFRVSDDGGNDDDDDDNYDDLEVTTRPAEDVDENSARLVGRLEEIGSGNVERWFEYDTDEDDLEDGDGTRLNVSGTTNSTNEFNRVLTGLANNRTYYFRACAEDDEGDEDCGSIRSFKTDKDTVVDDDDEGDRPSVTTQSVLGIGATYATCTAYYDANGASTATWFEWGTSSSLGNRTARVNQGNTEGGTQAALIGLSPNTTYYCRAAAENAYGTAYGAIKSFTTTGFSSGPTTPVVVVSGNGGAGTFLRLQIENGEEYVALGDRLEYEVEWENISGRDLENLVIEIDMPNQLTILDTDEGRISKKDNTVIINVGTLERGEDGNATITARVKSGRDGDPIVAQATAAFDHPTIEEKTQVNAIAYDSDEYDAYRAGLGASLFGLFGGSGLGILLILLLLVLIVLIARKQYMDNKAKKESNAPVAPAAPAAPATPEYRPYRPTPIQ